MKKVIATAQFQKLKLKPNELDHVPRRGEIFEVTKERFNILSGDNEYNEKFVEKLKPKRRKEQNKIAIIIPNYNYANYLERCLTSILNQTYTNYEIIFVDDMSTDDSLEIARKLLKSPHKVIELKQKRYNGGARNEGYLHMSKDVDYVWYVDSDDWLLDETALEKINEKLKLAPDVLFIGLSTYKNGITQPKIIPRYPDRYDAFEGWSGSSGKVIRKELATRQECLYNERNIKRR